VGLLHRQHGLAPQQWAAIWDEQNGLCYLCHEPMAKDDACIDHDHRHCPENASCSVCRRGLAHDECNRIAGQAHDNPALLRLVADSLEAALPAVEARIAAAGIQLSLFGIA
jgi:hypothetical protein